MYVCESLFSGMNASHEICDNQDIIRAGITQDIGVVVVIDASGTILSISSGHHKHGWVDREVKIEDIGLVRVEEVFHKEISKVVRDGVRVCGGGNRSRFRTYMCDIFFSKRTYVTMLSQPCGYLVIEIEDFDRNKLETNRIVDTSNIISRLTRHDSQEKIVNDLCEELFQRSSYDRAMTYRFLDDMSGEVIYESIREGMEDSITPFHGLRFPPGDIPVPARKAYAENPVRFIADVDLDSCVLLQKDRTISLSRSFLRGCVVPHKTYLQNMKVKSSLSIAITKTNGDLWGLISMHSYSGPRIPSIEDRVSYAILSSIVCNHLEDIERNDNVRADERLQEVVSRLNSYEPLETFMMKEKEAIFAILGVDGVSLLSPDGHVSSAGSNPASVDEIPLVDDDMTQGELDDPIRSYICLNVLDNRITFTRDFSGDPICWAGNPSEVQANDSTIMPRKSFERYLDHRSRTPPPFTKRDLVIFSRLKEILSTVIHRIEKEVAERRINQERRKSLVVENKSDENYAFFANMSHELRTPLHAINGIFDIMHEMKEEHDLSAYHRMIQMYTKIGIDTCREMSGTLNNILSIVRKTHEDNHVNLSSVSIEEIFSSVSQGLSMFAQSNDVRYEMEFMSDPKRVIQVDVSKIVQVFNNVVGNAIKFSDTGGEVEIKVYLLDSEEQASCVWSRGSRQFSNVYDAAETNSTRVSRFTSKWLLITVKDGGCGLLKEDMPRIFNMFSQVEDITTKRLPSTGLGLHISLENMRQLNGNLSVASTIGEGTVFCISVPTQETGREEPKRGSPDSRSSRIVSEKAVFVVVDDSEINRMILKKHIETTFTSALVYTADNGETAVECVDRLIEEGVVINGIFMDYHMPVMTGLQATISLRSKTSKNPSKYIPITMLTADITETSRKSMAASGADSILLKPTRSREIIKTCKEMIEMSIGK